MTLKVCILAYIAANAIATVALVGKQRRPITPGGAAVALVIFGFEAFAVLYWWPQ